MRDFSNKVGVKEKELLNDYAVAVTVTVPLPE